MRITIVENDTSLRGGGPRSYLEVTQRLAARGHEIHLVHGARGDFLPRYTEFCSSVTQVPGIDEQALKARGANLPVRPTARAVAATGPDVVYVNGLRHALHASLATVRRRGAAVCHLRINPPRRMPPAELAGVHGVSRFIAISHSVRDGHVAAGFDGDGIRVVHNGVDTDHYRGVGGPEVRAELDIPDDAFVLLYAGRLDQVKNVDAVVEAYRRLRHGAGPARLVVAGNPRVHASADAGTAYVDALRERAGPGAVFLPARMDVRPLYDAADVVLLPSRDEPFGRVVIEAMACGRPVLGAAVGGVPEILTGEFAAWMYDPDDVEALVDRVEPLRGWRRADPDLAARCRAHVVANFGLDRTVDGIEAVLEEATERGGRAGVRTLALATRGRRP